MGVPAGITLNPTYNAADQQAALMQSVNAASGNVIALNHTPPASWTFYTAAGADASSKSNLYYGKAGPDAITGYVADAGSINAALGHRRWLFFPQTLQMGTGDVPGDGTFARGAANATWILDTTAGGTVNSPRPATRRPQVSYPPAGYVPFQVVFPRWSFSYPQADFSAATVTMTRDGQPIPVTLEPLGNGTIVGENTLVWVYNNANSELESAHPRPAADIAYVVNVNNVRINGASQNFNYTVTVFDPDAPGADSAPTQIAGAALPPIRQASAFTVTQPSFAGSFDWRTLQFSPFNKTYNAEAGLDGLVPSITGDYAVVQNITSVGAGSSYRLTHAFPIRTQSLTLPDTYLVGTNNPSLVFSSRVGVAVATQVARVQISTDDGESWFDAFSQPGASLPNVPSPAVTDIAFIPRVVSLADYAGRTINVRFAYTGDPTQGSYTPSPNNPVGWFIDDITLGDVQIVSASAFTRVTSGSTFSVTPAAAGAMALQARGVMFNAYPIEWGPALRVRALDRGVNNNPGRLINMSIRTNAGTGDNTLIVGVSLGGAGTSGDKAVLLRGVGPTLGVFGVGGALSDSVMTVFQGTRRVAQNDDWAGGFDFSSVGAFAFSGATPRDAAIYNGTAAPDSYSIQITGKNNATGVALAEIYDATPPPLFTATVPRLINVSARTQVGTGENILIAGFVVGGNTPVRVLIRAVGPTLNAFGVGGVLADPRLEILNGTTRVAENDNWSSADAATFSTVGAFPLTANSRDAALVATLPPGNYTAQVTGVGNTTGVALVEVYELP